MWCTKTDITGHYLTNFGKDFIMTGKANKLQVGLFKMPYPLPRWAWEYATTERLLDWVDEPTDDWYNRITVGQLRYDRLTATILPKNDSPSWITTRNHQQIDGAFYVTKKTNELISVDVFYHPVSTYNGGRITYDISARGMCRIT